MPDIFESLWRIDTVFEGRKDDLKKQFVDTDKVPEKTFNYFVENDPSGKQKYLQWMLKQSMIAPDRYVHIKDVVLLFDKAVKQNKIKGQESDIAQYSLEQADELVQRKTKEVTKTQKKKQEKGQSTKIKETDDYLIVVPESYGASRFYGANTKWCISGKTSTFWKRYWEENIRIYMIMDKKKNKKYAVAVDSTGGKEIFDEEDESISMEELEKRMGVQEKDFRDIFQPNSAKDLIKRVIPSLKQVATQDAAGFWNSEGDVDLHGRGLIELPNLGIVKGFLDVSGNKLTTLEGAPQKVGRHFNCNDNRLTSLEGAPQEVGGGFYCEDNQLTSLKGSPQEVGGCMDAGNNQLITLEGAPQKVGGYFSCNDNQLTSLEGAPQEVGGGFYCGSNQLTTLEGAPQKVGKDFYCGDNRLTSLEGTPKEVGGHFNCNDNQLTSLEGAPQKLGGDLHCAGNLKSVSELRKTVDRPYDIV